MSALAAAFQPEPTLTKVVLRLFRRSDPFSPIDHRELAGGEVVIGRDPGNGWAIPDMERTVSRAHCTVALRDGRLTLRDTSSNGVFYGPRAQRAPPGEPVEIAIGDTLRFGSFMIVVEADETEADNAYEGPFNAPLLRDAPITEAAVQVPSEWKGAGPAAAEQPSDGSLLDAFCAGARLDASAFAGEDPAEVMRRLGEIYQQTVLGLSDLMKDRTSVKTQYRMSRTTVRPDQNNPFKWAPAQRVAADLLRPRGDGFLAGPAAVKASCEDLKKHLLCMMAGMRAAMASTLDSLAPEQAEARLEGRSTLLKNREALAFAEYAKLHAELRRQADTDPDSPASLAFRAAYERQLHELDAMRNGD